MNGKIRLWALLLSLLCAAVLGACAAPKEEAAVDVQMQTQLIQMSENLLGSIIALDEATLEENIATLTEKGQFELANGLSNWKTSRKELGSSYSVVTENAEISKDDEGYAVVLYLAGDLRSARVRVAYDRELTQISSLSFDPEYTVREKLAKAGLNTLIGMGTVFMVLIFIICIIALFKYVRIFEEKLTKSPKKEAPPAVDSALPAAAEANALQEEELLAVITAAIAAYEADKQKESQGQEDGGLIVRSLRRPDRKRRNF